jgi:glucan phosphoethanolaminetransferase (alkaline phosphatase superfamily)
MRIFLMLLGAVISAGALFVWIYLNGMAASWSTGNSKPSIEWFTLESVYWFWLPFVLGLALIVIGWMRG